MLAIYSNPTHCWYFLCTFEREFGAWSPLLLAFVANAPVLMELCGSRPSRDGLNNINLCLFCPNVDGTNQNTAFSSEQLLFLREQNQFSMTMPRGKAVAQVEHLPVITNLCFWGFLAFPTFSKLYRNCCVWHLHMWVPLHLKFKMYHNLLGSRFPVNFQHIFMALHSNFSFLFLWLC